MKGIVRCFKEYADQFESDMLIENNKLTDDLCIGLMATLRLDCLHPVLNSSWNPEETDFDVLEARIRSAYQTVDSEFRRQARGCRNLCSNWMVVYKEVSWSTCGFYPPVKGMNQRICMYQMTHILNCG